MNDAPIFDRLDTRPSFDSQFMAIAFIVAERATCDRAHVGCVLTVDNRIIATGYNGSISGRPHCTEIGHLMKDGHCCRTIHAERNALADCARRGVAVENAVCYITHSPCFGCAQVMVQAGVLEFRIANEYRDADEVRELVESAGVKWTLMEGYPEAIRDKFKSLAGVEE